MTDLTAVDMFVRRYEGPRAEGDRDSYVLTLEVGLVGSNDRLISSLRVPLSKGADGDPLAVAAAGERWATEKGWKFEGWSTTADRGSLKTTLRRLVLRSDPSHGDDCG